ncbi:unnamed protein product [Caenorhabditis angaria]|uniref:Peptidase M13 C-terminal domain-containing protein n=1 Tax=Caenorhabditis angaria TaxID=860376 RepID=A0A9P1N0J5_9PELO|nr:unnamed protein product [Caenorhabditis angaria]
MFLILFMFSTAFAFSYDLLKVIEDNIDKNVEACDNFYRHSCAKQNNSQTIKEYMDFGYSADLEEIDQKFISNSIQKSIVIAKNLEGSEEHFTKSYEIELKNLYIEKCERNNTEALKFLKTLQVFFNLQENEDCKWSECFSNLAMDSNCTRAAQTLYEGIIIKTGLDYYKLESLTKTYQNVLSIIWHVQNHEKSAELRKMFEFFKTELLSQIETTPWLINSKTVGIFKNITSQLYLSEMEIDIKTVIEDWLQFQKNYENCTSTYSELGQLAIDYCINKNLPEIREIEIFQNNAENRHPQIFIYNPLTAIMSKEEHLALKYGIFGANIGHKMGETIIVNNLEDGFFPYFSENVKNCVQDQFNETCRIYKESNCTVGDFDENGSDIFGISFGFDRLKQEMGEEIYNKIPGSKFGLTHAQAYFYAVSSWYCDRDDGANNDRVNSGVIQSPEFENVFNCPKDSRMVQSRKQFCHVLGEDAPQN